MRRHPHAARVFPAPALRLLVALLAAAGMAVLVAKAFEDNDGDGMDDAFETFFGLNATTNDAAFDYDADTLANLAESLLQTDPFIADTDRDGFPDAFDSNAVSRAIVPWGHAQFTSSNSVSYAWPPWMVAAFRTGGEWDTNTPAWRVPSTDTGLACLNMELDRALLTNDLRMFLPLLAGTNASLYLDLYDTNSLAVATNIGGNLLADVGPWTNKTLSIPMETNAAVGIRLRRENGEVAVGETRLYVDQDGDGLDADQEAQLGTSDLLSDSDGDGYGDATEVFYGTNPTDPGSFPTASVAGQGSDPDGPFLTVVWPEEGAFILW